MIHPCFVSETDTHSFAIICSIAALLYTDNALSDSQTCIADKPRLRLVSPCMPCFVSLRHAASVSVEIDRKAFVIIHPAAVGQHEAAVRPLVYYRSLAVVWYMRMSEIILVLGMKA